MSNTTSNFLTTPFPQEEEIYGSIPLTSVSGVIRGGISATVKVSQSVKGHIGNSATEATLISQGVKGEIGIIEHGQALVSHQIVSGEIGSSDEAVTNTGSHVITTGSGHTSLSAKVVITETVVASIGNSIEQTSTAASHIRGSIGATISEEAIAADLVFGSIGVGVDERHYKPTNRKVTLKVL